MSKKSTHIDRTYKDKPVLVVFFKSGTVDSYPFSNARYRQSYVDFFKLAESFFSIFVIRGKKNYIGQGVFRRGYRYARGRFHPYRALIPAKVVFDKGSLHIDGTRGWAIVCGGALSRILSHKDKTYDKFKQFMKLQYRVYTKTDCVKALEKIKTSFAVFKPVDNFGGVGVRIAQKEKLLTKLTRYDGVLCEFVDTSSGIPGLAQSLHDLRITVMDGKAVQVMVRIPRRGSYLSNVARGGAVRQFYPRKIPSVAYRIVRRVDDALARFGHRVYSVDMGFERGRPYVFELNNEPCVPYRTWGTSHYMRWHRALLKVLRAAAKDAGSEPV